MLRELGIETYASDAINLRSAFSLVADFSASRANESKVANKLLSYSARSFSKSGCASPNRVGYWETTSHPMVGGGGSKSVGKIHIENIAK